MTRSSICLAVAILAGLVAVVLLPSVPFEFSEDMDVHEQLVNNAYIRQLKWENLQHILTAPCVTSYYPVRTMSYALDYQIWGLRPAGFRFTNGLLHLANVVLVFCLVLRLYRYPEAGLGPNESWNVFWAAASAAVFAVHPVVVEPVAWIPGREELLMTLGALGCLHFHVSARRLGAQEGYGCAARAYHLCAALACAFACLSNAVGAIIPCLVTAWDVLTIPRLTLVKLLRGTAVLWLIGLLTLFVKATGDGGPVAEKNAWPSAERALLVLHVYWLNLQTLAWPRDLALLRPGIAPTSFLQAGVLLGSLMVALSLGTLLFLRRQRLMCFAMVWFFLALVPTSQVMPHHIQRADRFLYLPLAGLAVAAAFGMRWIVSGSSLRFRVVVATCVGAAVLVLTMASTLQVQQWRDAVVIWENCLRVDPDSSIANYSLGAILARRGETERALRHYEAALRLSPSTPHFQIGLAVLLATCPEKRFRDFDRAIRLAAKAVELDPSCFPILLQLRTRFAESLGEEGRAETATREYRAVLELHPDHEPALLALALLLATCPDEKIRAPAQALELARRTCRENTSPGIAQLCVLAAAYAAGDRVDEAITTLDTAIGHAEVAANRETVVQLRQLQSAYRAGQIPAHIPSALLRKNIHSTPAR